MSNLYDDTRTCWFCQSDHGPLRRDRETGLDAHAECVQERADTEPTAAGMCVRFGLLPDRPGRGVEAMLDWNEHHALPQEKTHATR